MKKNFKMSHPKHKQPRWVDLIKYEVKKYIKRERNKALPEGVDFWDFDCKYGPDEANSEEIHVSTINKHISQAEADGLDSFYLEILAKPGIRTKNPAGLSENQTDVDSQAGGEEGGESPE
ncbi:MAG: hypothetical protein C0623_01595 [Desulfuromonas sp.]|nr:MAG: hypothetical protein C0623_01595 [Desulfuromonas sp.]